MKSYRTPGIKVLGRVPEDTLEIAREFSKTCPTIVKTALIKMAPAWIICGTLIPYKEEDESC